MPAPSLLILAAGGHSPPARCLASLSAAEIERAARFSRDMRRSQFLWGRLLARALLARLAGEPRLLEQPPRPPVVVSPAGLVLSISHSGRWVACALASSPIGIDLEDRSNTREPIALADAALAPDQSGWVRASPDPALGFLQLWTLHECLTKLPGSAGRKLDVRVDPAPRLTGAGDYEWLCRSTPDYVLSVVASAARASRIETLSPDELCARLP